MVATHEHETERGARKAEAGVGASTWASASVAGMLGGIGMGLVMQFVMGIMPVVGALYGSKGVATGWLAHLFHSLVFSLVFAAVVSFDPVKKHAGEFPESVGVGAGYGVVLWVFGGVFMFPIWLSSAGLPGPGVPAVNPVALGAHLVYGVVVGVTYPLILRNATKASDVAVTRRSMWISVGMSGLAAGVVMGLILQFVMKIMPAIGALYGVPGVVGGWLGHLFHSLVFAVVFGGLASLGPIKKYANAFPTSVPVAVVYGVVLWVFGSVVVMPLWLSSLGMKAPPVPNISEISLLAHLVYGSVLGVLYPVVLDFTRRKL